MTELFVDEKYSLKQAVLDANSINDDVKISIGEGRFEISETIEIMRDNIEIVGVSGKTILAGSKRINISNMKRVNNIINIELKDYGIYDYGKFGEGPFIDFWKKYDIPKPHMCDFGPGLEVFYEESPLSNARYPKSGFIHIKKAVGETAIEYQGERNGSKEGRIIADDDVVKNWGMEKDLLLIGYWNMDWATQRHTVKDINTGTGVIEVNEPYHIYGYRDGKCFATSETGGRFYATNVLSQLNMEGEWHINREAGLLSVYPFQDQAYINVSVCEDIFLINNRKNIKISNLTLEECRKSGVMILESDDIFIDNCTVKNTGAWGILGEHSTNVKVDNCHVFATGGGGIGLEGGDRNTLTSSNNVISNNTVHDIARWHRTYLAALEICGVGGVVTGNKVYDVPHFAMIFHGNNHIIEKNELYNACYESNDAGAIYCGKDWSCRGNIIRYNYIHDLAGFKGDGCLGIYFDDGMSSAEVYGNILANIPYSAILIGGGRDFKVHDNIFYNCKFAVMIDNRVETWNISLFERLKERLAKVEYTNEIWQKAYPELVNFFDKSCKLPENNEITNNTIVGGSGTALSDAKILEFSKVENNTFIPMDVKSNHAVKLADWTFCTK